MNKKQFLLLICALSLTTGVPTLAFAAGKCSLRTLKGTYIYASTGSKGGSLYVEAGQEIFDGKGGITNTYTNSAGVEVVTQGSYDLDENCVGQASYDDTGDQYEIYTGPAGTEFSWISLSKNTRLNGKDVRVTPAQNPRCSTRTLKGTYIYSHIGYRKGVQYIESGQDVFDGQGMHWNTFTDATGKTITTTGTYSVGKNCIGRTSYADTGDSYAIYVDPRGTELRYALITTASDSLGVGNMQRVGREVNP